ncbi:MAG TPA: DinB family protein [Dehalococcoidia bacterium]|nr:DinB family protein [Dehalococcoidia bacterium]
MARRSSYGTLAADLTHLARVQHRWSTVVAETDTPDHVQPPTTDIAPAIRDLLAQSEVALHQMLDMLTEETSRPPSPESAPAKLTPGPRWHLVEHIANHSAHHRAEVGQLLHGLGASPGDMDFVDFVDPDEALPDHVAFLKPRYLLRR